MIRTTETHALAFTPRRKRLDVVLIDGRWSFHVPALPSPAPSSEAVTAK